MGTLNAVSVLDVGFFWTWGYLYTSNKIFGGRDPSLNTQLYCFLYMLCSGLNVILCSIFYHMHTRNTHACVCIFVRVLCINMPLCVSAHMCAGRCMCVQLWKPEVDIGYFGCSSPYILRQVIWLYLELIILDTPASRLVSGTPYLYLSCAGLTSRPPHSAGFCMVPRINLKSSGLCGSILPTGPSPCPEVYF